ncbi:zinc homeostasis factor 1 [Apiospora hydei]|uniref:Zinc homeostasis factor 1 n=1 Tax=Apiospora hydei TaxID=1337664 RepID=A0ABR1VWL0_9PEZI
MHVQVAFPITEEGGKKYMKLAKSARKCLHEYGIHSATIQPEFCLDETCNHLDVSMTTDVRRVFLNAWMIVWDRDAALYPPSQNGDAGSHKSGHSGHSHSNGHDHGHDHEHGHEHRH